MIHKKLVTATGQRGIRASRTGTKTERETQESLQENRHVVGGKSMAANINIKQSDF